VSSINYKRQPDSQTRCNGWIGSHRPGDEFKAGGLHILPCFRVPVSSRVFGVVKHVATTT